MTITLQRCMIRHLIYPCRLSNYGSSGLLLFLVVPMLIMREQDGPWLIYDADIMSLLLVFNLLKYNSSIPRTNEKQSC